MNEQFSFSPKQDSTAEMMANEVDNRAQLVKTPYGGKAVDFGEVDTQSLLSDQESRR